MRFDPSYDKFKNCLCADGETAVETEESANKKVTKLMAWQYVRTGLVIIGAYSVIMWIMKRIK